MNNNQAFDAVVVGAGVIGCSIAYHLVSAGLKTALLDQAQVGAGASGANLGMVQSNDAELQHSIPMVAASFTRYKTLEEQLDFSLEFKRIGILHLLPSEEYWSDSLQRAEALTQAGIACEMLDARQAVEVEPLIDPASIIGAVYAPHQGQVNPFRLMWGYLRRALPKGLSLHTFTRVTGFNLQSGRIQGVFTNHGAFSAPLVILATAAWTKTLGRLLEQDWPVHTFRASAMVTEPIPSTRFRTIISTADHVELSIDGAKDVELSLLGLRQTSEGHFLISQADRPGSSLEPLISSQASHAMSLMAARYFPFLRGIRILRTWTAPTTFTDDGCPFIGPVPGLQGLIMATAFRSSLINTPIAGEIVADLVLNGSCSILDITPFALDRQLGSADTYYVVKSTKESPPA